MLPDALPNALLDFCSHHGAPPNDVSADLWGVLSPRMVASGRIALIFPRYGLNGLVLSLQWHRDGRMERECSARVSKRATVPDLEPSLFAETASERPFNEALIAPSAVFSPGWSPSSSRKSAVIHLPTSPPDVACRARAIGVVLSSRLLAPVALAGHVCVGGSKRRFQRAAQRLGTRSRTRALLAVAAQVCPMQAADNQAGSEGRSSANPGSALPSGADAFRPWVIIKRGAPLSGALHTARIRMEPASLWGRSAAPAVFLRSSLLRPPLSPALSFVCLLGVVFWPPPNRISSSKRWGDAALFATASRDRGLTRDCEKIAWSGELLELVYRRFIVREGECAQRSARA
ncbi:hypothetical protein MRX96_037354 [Rhipicephalus microplus]